MEIKLLKKGQKARYLPGVNPRYDDILQTRVRGSAILNEKNHGTIGGGMHNLSDMFNESRRIDQIIKNLQCDVNQIYDNFEKIRERERENGFKVPEKMNSNMHNKLMEMEARLDFFTLERYYLADAMERAKIEHEKTYGRPDPAIKTINAIIANDAKR